MASQWSSDKAKAQVAVNHLFHTLDRTPLIDAYDESGDRPSFVKGELEFKHVVFSYPSRPDIPIFTDFDLKIESGTTVAFCGPSGSGKSTTIALLQRFYSPDAGSVCLDSRDISTLNLSWLRKQMALVQQEPVLFAGTVLENIAYGREGASKEECQQAAEAANAHNFVSALPDGYATEVGERGAQLSGGQKQRIAIARSMVRDPAVLLLDEATSALDTESERVVQEALDKLLEQSRRTTLVIAHRLSTIVNSDLICVIYQGQIVEKGTHSELMRIPDGHYKKLASRQHGGQ
uniref:ABC transporter domain-containing protein n=1 Tax=Alexandrium catenella TaxID=2925 RepID=A0A7S1RE86_ALECA